MQKRRETADTSHGAQVASTLATISSIVTLALLLVPVPARAQFVCDSVVPGGANGATAAGSDSVACGTEASAVGGSTSVGRQAGSGSDPTNIYNSAFGADTGVGVTGDFNTAIGVGSGRSVTGNYNTAVGRASGQDVDGDNNIAMGLRAGNDITASDTVSIGTNSLASADRAIAIGFETRATGVNSIAIGNGAVASGSIAIGDSATAGSGGAAFGDFTTATGTNSSAIGPNATATHANSAAFGNGATTSRADQQVFGAAANTYTMAGIASQASRDAQTGSIYLVTSDGDGNLATTGFDVGGFQSQFATLSGEISNVGALSAALAGLHPNARSKGDNHLSGAIGTYNGQVGLAAGYFRNVGDNALFSVGGAMSGGDVSANAGVTLSW